MLRDGVIVIEKQLIKSRWHPPDELGFWCIKNRADSGPDTRGSVAEVTVG